MTALAPVELLVYAFDDDEVPESVFEALDRLRGSGLRRLLDLVVVRIDSTGEVVRLAGDGPTRPESLAVGSALWHMLGGETGVVPPAQAVGMPSASGQVGLDLDMLEDLAGRLQPNTTALLLLVERRWTADLEETVRAVHGTPLVQALLVPETMLVLGPHLAAVAEAEANLEVGAAVAGSAQLDALASDPDPTTAIAANTVRALVVAGFIHDADVVEAINALGDSDLVGVASVEQARRHAHDVARVVGRIPRSPGA